jgi:hypothetical protein
MNEVFEKIRALRLIPVVKIENSQDAVPVMADKTMDQLL